MIGFPQSSVTIEMHLMVIKEATVPVELITPSDFFSIPNKDDYQYIVAFTLDGAERINVINYIDTNNLDCITIINDTVTIGGKGTQYEPIIGAGSCITFSSTLLYGSVIGRHSIIEAYSLVAHETTIGNNAYLHVGTMIAGKTSIGNNCTFNFRSSVINALTITDNVSIGAASTVTKDITKSGHYVGTPARRVRDFELLTVN